MSFDQKQISSIEKAVEEKYGQEAVLDPSSLWNSEKEKAYLEQVKEVEKFYREQRLERQIDIGGFLIREKLVSKKSFQNCSLCKEQVYKASDETYMTKFNCCFKCYVLKIEGRENGRNSK